MNNQPFWTKDDKRMQQFWSDVGVTKGLVSSREALKILGVSTLNEVVVEYDEAVQHVRDGIGKVAVNPVVTVVEPEFDNNHDDAFGVEAAASAGDDIPCVVTTVRNSVDAQKYQDACARMPVSPVTALTAVERGGYVWDVMIAAGLSDDMMESAISSVVAAMDKFASDKRNKAVYRTSQLLPGMSGNVTVNNSSNYNTGKAVVQPYTRQQSQQTQQPQVETQETGRFLVERIRVALHNGKRRIYFIGENQSESVGYSLPIGALEKVDGFCIVMDICSITRDMLETIGSEFIVNPGFTVVWKQSDKGPYKNVVAFEVTQ